MTTSTQNICQTIINEKTGEICGHSQELHHEKGCSQCIAKHDKEGELCIDCPCEKFQPVSIGCGKEYDVNDMLDVDSIKICGKNGLCEDCQNQSFTNDVNVLIKQDLERKNQSQEIPTKIWIERQKKRFNDAQNQSQPVPEKDAYASYLRNSERKQNRSQPLDKTDGHTLKSLSDAGNQTPKEVTKISKEQTKSESNHSIGITPTILPKEKNTQNQSQDEQKQINSGLSNKKDKGVVNAILSNDDRHPDTSKSIFSTTDLEKSIEENRIKENPELLTLSGQFDEEVLKECQRIKAEVEKVLDELNNDTIGQYEDVFLMLKKRLGI